MFRNTRRGTTGLGALIAVAVIICAYVGAAGMMWYSYRDAGAAPQNAQCQVVCGPTTAKQPANG